MKKFETYNQVVEQNLFLLENLQGGVVYSDYDPPFHLRYASEGMGHLSGYTPAELIQMHQSDLVHDDDIDSLFGAVEQQLLKGDTFEVEYRLKRKDGSFIHVLDRAKIVTHADGKKYVHCLLTDITELKMMQQALHVSQEKYKVVIEQSGNAILEYDLETQALLFSENYHELFGCVPPEGTLHQVIRGQWLLPEYRDKVDALFVDVITKKISERLEIQIIGEGGRLVWCQLNLTPILDKRNNVSTVMGCLQNIDEQKKYLEVLTERSQKDGLTQIYNRLAMESMINQYLETWNGKECYGLIALDIDYFKQVNDEFGHDVGDDVLVQMTQQVSRMLPPEALFGRLGGDEFLIFLQHQKSMDDMHVFMQHIVDGVREAFKAHHPPITVSMGLAVGMHGQQSFKDLYQKADVALYQAKHDGRNRACLFQEP